LHEGDETFDASLVDELGAGLTGLTIDSREVAPGLAFAAMPGGRHDGRDHIPQAIAAGASAVIWERQDFEWNEAWLVPNLGVWRLREHLGEIAAHIHGDPTGNLWTIGVTGTNGKTSVSQWLAEALSGLGRKTAVVGTLGNGFPGNLTHAGHTTPDAASLQAALARYRAQGAQAVAMEVSSHGLHQGRVNGVHFKVAVLTNLSRDHLDYHGDMQAYADAKADLFEWPGLEWAVLNGDDAFGVELQERLRGRGIRVLSYGLQLGDLRAVSVEAGAAGLNLEIASPWGIGRLETGLVGIFNAYNLLAALGALMASGVDWGEALAQLARVQAPAGRMQRMGGGDRPLVVVDYAHTPDALEKVLLSLREILHRQGRGRLITVFGCGGDRDRGKRPQMGEVAGRLSGAVMLTSDNPRGEDPQAILNDIASGMGGAFYETEPNRALAISRAVGCAHQDDIVLVAGKGHEDYQEIAGRRFPFSDAEVVSRALREWRGTGR
jgi:UDP-N-acetylmuramoyl-L-alanyl-D-glutamate--2,6-diaminopimelate ligase